MSNPTSTVKNLLVTLHDGQEGFAHASENARDPQLKELFARLSLQRAEFIKELEPQLAKLGASSKVEGPSIHGTMHQAWIDLKAAITKGESHSILSEAERGEDMAKKVYQNASADPDLPEAVRTVVSKQAAAVLASHDEMKALRDATK
jgi:uncharacterized protein (TIGR02284 family)